MGGDQTAAPPRGGGRVWTPLTDAFLRQREASIIVVAIVLAAYFQFSNRAFLSVDNIQTLAQFTGATTIIAVGEVLLLILGEIDLSVGNTFALAPFIMAFAYQAGIPLVLGIAAALLAGAAIGMVNGMVTVLFKVPSFVTTLGTLFLLNGLTLTISNGFPVPTPGGPAFAAVMGRAPYSEILWAFGFVAALQIVVTRTRWGLHTIATGGNLTGASEVGINVNWVRIGNFMLASLFAAFAGMLDAYRITSIDPLAGGTAIMFTAVAGSVIGGTALTGGSGTVVGALLGNVVLSVLKDGFTLLGVSAFTFDIILGAMILVAMIANIRLQLARSAGRS